MVLLIESNFRPGHTLNMREWEIRFENSFWPWMFFWVCFCMINWSENIISVVPRQDSSHHQDYEQFLVGDPELNLHLPQLLGGGTTQNIMLNLRFLLNFFFIYFNILLCDMSLKTLKKKNGKKHDIKTLDCQILQLQGDKHGSLYPKLSMDYCGKQQSFDDFPPT